MALSMGVETTKSSNAMRMVVQELFNQHKRMLLNMVLKVACTSINIVLIHCEEDKRRKKDTPIVHIKPITYLWQRSG